MKEQHNRFAVVTAFLMAVLCAVQLSVSTYAWLAGFVKGDRFGYTAGELPPYTLELARIPYSDAGREDTERVYYPCSNYQIETNSDGTHLEAAIENMTFGTIDNVAQLKAENVVYLRLTVPKSCGDTVRLNLHYSQADFITLYQKTIDEMTGDIQSTLVTDEAVLDNLIAVESTEKANDSFLLYDAVVSNQAWQANEIAQNVAFAQNEEDYLRFGVDNTTFETLTNTAFDQVTDNYYLYIKIIPNLSVFAYSIEYLSAIMPCYMYFAIGAVFDSATMTETI